MPYYLIYHPQRQITEIRDLKIYHDEFGGNEDPYLWNDRFLHTYCHITQLKNEEGQINFWVSAEKLTDINYLLCDCVFVIQEKIFWKESNKISREDDLVENFQTYEHHYKWPNKENGSNHFYSRRRRYTLKADPEKSFQPQDKDRNLIDVLPFLIKNGLNKKEFLSKINPGVGARPFKLDDDLGKRLYKYLEKIAYMKLRGRDLKNLHPYKDITSPIDGSAPCC